MRRYWFRFDVKPGSTWVDVLRVRGGIFLGCGVTAHDLADADALLRERVFDPGPVPPVVEVIEDVAITGLDPGHVLPNMGDPTQRGIWFPLGYDPM